MDSNSPSAPPPLSEAQQRFQSCRWQRAAEADSPACCGHRDVLPMAGTTGFNPESWCHDCGLFKVKRSPRARPAPDDNRWR